MKLYKIIGLIKIIAFLKFDLNHSLNNLLMKHLHDPTFNNLVHVLGLVLGGGAGGRRNQPDDRAWGRAAEDLGGQVASLGLLAGGGNTRQAVAKVGDGNELNGRDIDAAGQFL